MHGPIRLSKETRGCSSIYHGVRKTATGKYSASFQCRGNRTTLGTFAMETEAAWRYDQALQTSTLSPQEKASRTNFVSETEAACARQEEAAGNTSYRTVNQKAQAATEIQQALDQQRRPVATCQPHLQILPATPVHTAPQQPAARSSPTNRAASLTMPRTIQDHHTTRMRSTDGQASTSRPLNARHQRAQHHRAHSTSNNSKQNRSNTEDPGNHAHVKYRARNTRESRGMHTDQDTAQTEQRQQKKPRSASDTNYKKNRGREGA